MGKGIIKGIRVLDFTRVLAGPFTTRILADFGAEVIKVRSGTVPGAAEENRGAYFNAWNRNKLGITLNMSRPEARELVLRLVSITDVVIENFTPRVMSNWGIAYEDLRKIREDIIMISMSGMGQTGPWRDFTAYGPTIQSLCGLTFLTSYDRKSPMGLGYSHADAIAGLYGALAVLAALEYKDKTGKGQFIDLSEYEVGCTLLGTVFMDLTANQKDILPQGNRTGYISAAPYGCYPCLGDDRWCAIAVFDNDEWKAFCEIIGDPPWTREERFLTMAERRKHWEELDRRIEGWTMKQRAEEIVQRLQAVNISSGIIQDARDLAYDPHLMARSFFKEIGHPSLGTIRTDVCPIRIQGGGEGPWEPSHKLGEDNDYVYSELLGLSEDQIDSYTEKGVFI